jgi:hypothetical protein
MRWTMLAAAGWACGSDEAPNLLPELDGRWAGELSGDEGTVQATASFTWSEDAEALEGEVVIEEADGDRAFEVLEAVSVEELGVGLMLAERGGVHELFLDALAPLDPFEGAWRDEWYCGEGTGFCQLSGGFSLSRR